MHSDFLQKVIEQIKLLDRKRELSPEEKDARRRYMMHWMSKDRETAVEYELKESEKAVVCNKADQCSDWDCHHHEDHRHTTDCHGDCGRGGLFDDDGNMVESANVHCVPVE